MGIRTGKEYLDGLRDEREIWINGARIEDVTTHPAVCRAAHTLGGFMDRPRSRVPR
jgi:aromatic ring hydroxylase